MRDNRALYQAKFLYIDNYTITINYKRMGILTWIIVGLLAGAIAKALHPGKDPGGFIVTILIGIAGAVVGGWISSLFGFGRVDGFDIGSLFIAILGAILLLFLYRKFSSRA
jgi:uncharacterized membrane protein YeaQ/YmgE (transglycosylase-associated protein family)